MNKIFTSDSKSTQAEISSKFSLQTFGVISLRNGTLELKYVYSILDDLRYNALYFIVFGVPYISLYYHIISIGVPDVNLYTYTTRIRIYNNINPIRVSIKLIILSNCYGLKHFVLQTQTSVTDGGIRSRKMLLLKTVTMVITMVVTMDLIGRTRNLM